MKIVILSGNPKTEGLCHGVIEAARKGAEDGGAQVETLPVDKTERCRSCGGGWGACLKEHACAFGNDGFSTAQGALKGADQVIIITPVYWGEATEGLKCFLDRFRRCEFNRDWLPRPPDQPPALRGKQILLVASAGGSGSGILTCMDQLDRFCENIGAPVFDHIAVNRWNRDYKTQAVYQAARAMAEGRTAGKTLR
ncbi:MAG: flavodoxin family protein [Spirochaetaceae bacterium]|jgi:multimeric flavodoxin WrbA|nr:flavodoxin family protein [Spirochaetaceae bacterium]